MNAQGWNAQKVAIFREQFMAFLSVTRVNSKEMGEIILGQHIYTAQKIVLDRIFEGLSNDIHDFKIGKSRQLGVTTLSRALTLFWIGMHPGMRGYMVFDTAEHREEARQELLTMIRSLPDGFGFPAILDNNRSLLALSNESRITFAAAGVKESKSSGTLGRSSGINFVHGSELCSWSSNAGLEAFKNALAEDYPDRLYIWESTARGYNLWKDIWDEALEDPNHQMTIFCGWWAKDNQRIARTHPDFARYGEPPPSEKEALRIRQVKEQYGFDVTQEMLAWYRRKMDPTAKADGDAPVEFEGDGLKIQEQPWTEEEMWQQSGATFFTNENLTTITNKFATKKFETWTFITGVEFKYTQVYKARNAKEVQLKVWEEPSDQAVYVLAVDPAFGRNEANDRSAIQVMRCYADGMDQVAEYAWPLITTKQLAWVIAVLGGWYGSRDGSEVHLIIELNGPGQAVFDELQDLKREMAYERASASEAEKSGLQKIFFNMRQFLYSRPDAVNPSRSSYHWITNDRRKVQIMERLRDFVSSEMIRLRSFSTIEEMKAITREGDSIEAPGGKKDDRVLALAFAVHCWEDRVRRTMRAQKRTRANEEAKRRMSITDQIYTFNQHQLGAFLGGKQAQRAALMRLQTRRAWRGR